MPTPKANNGVRPIAISESFYKLATMYAMSLITNTLPMLFEPLQLGVGAVGGTERAVHILQAGLEPWGQRQFFSSVTLRTRLMNVGGISFLTLYFGMTI
jgi:hypothetical protein